MRSHEHRLAENMCDDMQKLLAEQCTKLAFTVGSFPHAQYAFNATGPFHELAVRLNSWCAIRDQYRMHEQEQTP